jgi:chemotaxis protein MotB
MSDVPHKKIYVIKRPVMAAAHHGGAWKIAFADFMTAMFAFFLVMWLLSTSSPAQLKGVADQFKMPLKVAVSGGAKSSNSASVIPGGGDDPVSAEGELIKTTSEAQEISDKKSLDDLKDQLDQMIASNPVLDELRPQLLIEITPEGLRIQIIDSKKRPMFERSSAVVASYMRTLLRELGPVLNTHPNKVTLSGHTDATVYFQGNRSYSNWELSADRANASRRELVAGGMGDEKVLRVMGLASSMSFVKDDPFADENRRISIVVLNNKTQIAIEAANASGHSSITETAVKASRAPAKKPVNANVEIGAPALSAPATPATPVKENSAL